MGDKQYISSDVYEELEVYLKFQQENIKVILTELLGQSIEIKAEMPSVGTLEDVNNYINDFAVVIKLSFEGYLGAPVYAIADLSSALIISGVMSMFPVDIIAKKIKEKDLNDTDEAAFSEIINFLLEGINKAVTENVSPKLILNVDDSFRAKFKPGLTEIGELNSENDYLILKYSFDLKENLSSGFYMLFQRKGVEKLFKVEIDPALTTMPSIQISMGKKIVAVVYESSIKDGLKIRKMLESANVSVVLFNELKGMIIGLKKENVDVLILTMSPNNWNSLMFLKHFRRDPEKMKLPVILIVAKPSKEMIFNAHKLGMKKIITKPLRREDILFAIKDIVQELSPTSGKKQQ